MKTKMKIYFAFAIIMLTAKMNAQLPPAIQWQNISWDMDDLSGNPQTQDQSGEDWWYSQKNVYNTSGQHTGHITVGFTSLVSTSATYTAAANLYNEGPASVYNTINHNNLGPCINYDYSTTCPEGCNDRDYVGEHRTPPRGNAALNDLNGNMIWCHEYINGEMQEVIQDGLFFYLVGRHFGARPFGDYVNFIPYNPTSSNPADYFDLSNTSLALTGTGSNHLFVAKIDMLGNVIWSGLYGMPDFATSPSTALNTYSYGYDIIKSSNGNIIVSGIGVINDLSTSVPQPFVAEIQASTGYVLNKTLLPLTGVGSTDGSQAVASQGESHSLIEIGTTGNYAVACNYFFFANTSTVDFNEAVVWNLNSSLAASSTWGTNPMRFPGNGGPSFMSNIWEIKYHAAHNELLIPVVRDCAFCAFAGNNNGTGFIYRVTPSGFFSTGTNPSPMGPVGSFDLRIGVEETPDGGFVAVSSRHNVPFVTPTAAESGYLATCTTITGDYGFWDTDPVVIKYDATGNQVWLKTFDVIPGRARQTPPGDLKRQECLYKISVAQDGGYVVAGNTSHNFDDNYLFKLYNDCSSSASYDITGTGNVINLTGVTNWSGLHSVLGTVVVNAGATLNISGPTTVIQFADSKTTGILTNIDVKIGGTLNIFNGAKLTSTTGCPNAMWDGIILEGTVLAQLPAFQARAFLSGNGRIENARTAVMVGAQTTTFKNGAILQTTGFNFYNNNVDVMFNPYKAPLVLGNEPNNKSFLHQTNFVGDAVLNDPTYVDVSFSANRRTTDKHVWLNRVKGIYIQGCNFTTDVTPAKLTFLFPTTARSYGIYSTDAIFTVMRACNIININGCAGSVSTFNNLYYGIYAENTNPLKTFTSTTCNFTDCWTGIYESGINYSTVVKNNFLKSNLIPSPNTKACNINPANCDPVFHYLNQCNGFTHQENTFTVLGTQHVRGTIFNNTSSSASLTYRNTYSGLFNSNQIQLNNPLLQVQCNLSSSVKNADFIVTSGSLPAQGACGTMQTPANNTFSHFSSVIKSDINSVTNFTYTYYPNPPAGSQVPFPSYISTTVGPNPCPFATVPFDYNTACPVLTGCGLACRFANITSNITAAQNLNVPIVLGNAQALYNAISSNMSDGNLKNLLMSKSPYLSDGVMTAYLNRNSTPSAGNIKLVIIANSPVTAAVMTTVLNLNLPNGIMNQINNAQHGVSARQELTDEINYYKNQVQFNIDAAISLLLNDTLLPNKDTTIERLLRLERTDKGRADLANLFTANGDFANAQTFIDSVKAVPHLLKKGNFLQHNKDLRQQGKTWSEIQNDAALRNDILNLAMDSTLDGFANARGVFAEVENMDGYQWVEDVLNTNARLSEPAQENSEKLITENELALKAFPNPFREELNVLVPMPENVSHLQVQFIEPATGKILAEKTVTGKQPQVTFNTNEFSSGLYLICVRGGGITPRFIKVVNFK